MLVLWWLFYAAVPIRDASNTTVDGDTSVIVDDLLDGIDPVDFIFPIYPDSWDDSVTTATVLPSEQQHNNGGSIVAWQELETPVFHIDDPQVLDGGSGLVGELPFGIFLVALGGVMSFFSYRAAPSIALALGFATTESQLADVPDEVPGENTDAVTTLAVLPTVVSLSPLASPTEVSDEYSPSPRTPSEVASLSAPVTPLSSQGLGAASPAGSLALLEPSLQAVFPFAPMTPLSSGSVGAASPTGYVTLLEPSSDATSPSAPMSPVSPTGSLTLLEPSSEAALPSAPATPLCSGGLGAASPTGCPILLEPCSQAALPFVPAIPLASRGVGAASPTGSLALLESSGAASPTGSGALLELSSETALHSAPATPLSSGGVGAASPTGSLVPIEPSWEAALPSAPATPLSSGGLGAVSPNGATTQLEASSVVRQPLAERQVECHAQLGMWYVAAVDGPGQVIRVLSIDAHSGILNVQAYSAKHGKTGRLTFRKGNATLQLEPCNLRRGPFQIAPGGRAPPEITTLFGRGQKRPIGSVSPRARQLRKMDGLGVSFRFTRSLSQLTGDLGFRDTPELRDALTRHGGSVSACLQEILGDAA
jgi:hypothetical protein